MCFKFRFSRASLLYRNTETLRAFVNCVFLVTSISKPHHMLNVFKKYQSNISYILIEDKVCHLCEKRGEKSLAFGLRLRCSGSQKAVDNEK